MKRSIPKLLSLLLILALSNCSNTGDLPGFDAVSWRSDSNGCIGKRNELLDEIKERKEEMKEWKSEEIDAFLGNPDSKDLDKRNRLYYRYDISGSEKCENSTGEKVYLQIRFNAINRADELIVFE